MIFLCLSLRSAALERVIVGLPVIKGMEKTSMVDLFTDIVNTVSGKMDVKAIPNIFTYEHDDDVAKIVMDNVESGDSDIIFWTGQDYSEYLDTGKDTLVPLFSLTMMGKTIVDSCIYARKGEIKNISELRGKRWAGTRVSPTRYLLYKEGIDEPVDKFFGSVQFKSDSPITNIVEGLENNEYDAFTSYDTYIGISGMDTKKDKPFEPVVCHEYDNTWTFMASKRLPHEFMEKYRKIMLKSYKDPDFAKFKFAFNMIRGRFIPVKNDEVQRIKKIYDLRIEKGWDREDKKFWKEYYSPPEKEKEKE